MTVESAPAYQSVHDDTLLIPCPRCGGRLVKRVEYVEADNGTMRCESVRCLDCKRVLSPPDTGHGHTQERVERGHAPLRRVVGVERGFDGEGMQFSLSCGHSVRLQRKADRFSQKSMRCVQCFEEGRR